MRTWLIHAWEMTDLHIGPATHCNTLQHTATHRNTLHHTATHCNTPSAVNIGLEIQILQHTATHYSALKHTAIQCSTQQHAAIQCNTLQYTATHCHALQHTATHSNTQQHTATHRSTQQHTATDSNTLQHTATHRVRSILDLRSNVLPHTYGTISQMSALQSVHTENSMESWLLRISTFHPHSVQFLKCQLFSPFK